MSNDVNKLVEERKSTIEGRRTASEIRGTDKNSLERQIKNMDKTEMMKKLNEIGLSPLAKKLEGMSKDDILRGLNSNPKILDKIKDLLK